MSPQFVASVRRVWEGELKPLPIAASQKQSIERVKKRTPPGNQAGFFSFERDHVPTSGEVCSYDSGDLIARS